MEKDVFKNVARFAKHPVTATMFLVTAPMAVKEAGRERIASKVFIAFILCKTRFIAKMLFLVSHISHYFPYL